MLTLLLAVGVALLIVVMFSGWLAARRPLHTRRSVLLHAPMSTAWESIRDFPSLLIAHGRGGAHPNLEEYEVVRGDGLSDGSVWKVRGRWNGRPYWVEMQIVRFEPEKRLAVRLLRDSLRTHRGLRSHLGCLSLTPNGPDSSKLSWELLAELRGMRLPMARLLASRHLPARLLDLGLRSVKVDIDEAHRESLDQGDRSAARDGAGGEVSTRQAAPGRSPHGAETPDRL